MAKPKLKPEIKTETLVSAAPKWNVVVLNDPINYQAYVVVAFMSVSRSFRKPSMSSSVRARAEVSVG